MTWLPVGHLTYAKYSFRLNSNSPRRNVRYPCSFGSLASTLASGMASTAMAALLFARALPDRSWNRLTDIGPLVDGVRPGDGLKEDHAGLLGAELIRRTRGQ